MASTYTTNARLAKPATGDLLGGSTVNANMDLLDGVSAIGALAVTVTEIPSASLNVRVTAGTFRKSDGTLVSYAGTSSQAMTLSSTNYLYLGDTGTLTVNTSGFPSAWHVRLATVVAGASTITSVTDARVSLPSSGLNLNSVYLALAGGTLADGANAAVGTSTGTKIGTAATQKLGLWGVTPVVQPSGASQAAVGSLALQSLTVSTGGTPGTTLAAATNTASLTDSTGGSASTTLASISDTATANAVASLAAQLATQRALNTVLINTVTSLGTQLNNALADLGTLKTLANALRSAMVAVGTAKGSA